MRSVIAFLTILTAFFGLVSLLGRIHPAADTLALGRPALAAFCLPGLLVCRSIWARLLTGGVALGLALTVVPSFLPQGPGSDIRVYSKNLWYANDALPDLVADIKSAGVDVVMLQEVSDRNAAILALLKADFPYQAFCRFSNWSGIAIASRLPADGAAQCTDRRAAAALPVTLDGVRVWVIAAHIPWLWPYDSADNEDAAVAMIARLEGPVIVAGDFNAFPWTHRVGRIADASHARLAGPLRPTFWYRGLPLPLDFAMAPGGGSVEVRPRLGSDHAGIVADLSLIPR